MKKDILKIVISIAVFLIAYFVKFNSELINNLLFFLSYVIVGIEVILNAIENIRKGEIFDEEFPTIPM